MITIALAFSFWLLEVGGPVGVVLVVTAVLDSMVLVAIFGKK